MDYYDSCLEYNVHAFQNTNQERLQKALFLIQEAVLQENNEKKLYTYLTNNATKEEDRLIIMDIYNNELKHHDYFNEIYNQLSQKILKFQHNINYTSPSSFCDGLKLALLVEQNKIQKYRDIYFAIQGEEHKYKIMEIITDEIRHTMLINFLYSKNNCTI